MKICFCIGRISYSGAENVVSYLAEQMSNEGQEVSIILTYKFEETNFGNVMLYNAVSSKTGLPGTFERISKTRKLLKKIRPSVFVIFNCEMAFSGIPASLGLDFCKTVVCERNDPKRVPTKRFRRNVRNILYSFADAGVFQTEVIGDYFKNIVKKRKVIGNPIREKYDECLPAKQREKVFVTVARLDNYQKNQEFMIRVFAEVVKKYPEYQLHILGEGPDKENYYNLINSLGMQQNVFLKGNISNPSQYIRKCRAFLLTSEFEGMPNALIEAMALGLPCISTDCGGGGAAALIRNNVNGMLIACGAESALYQSIVKLILSDELCDDLGRNAYLLNDELNGKSITNQWMEFFDELQN